MARSLGEELLELPPNELIARVHQIEGRVQAVTQALSQANRYREQPVLVYGKVCRVGGWVGGGWGGRWSCRDLFPRATFFRDCNL